MAVRRRRPTVTVVYRPDMPRELLEYRPGAWMDQPLAPAGTETWEQQLRAAYQRWRAAVDAWHEEHGHKPFPPGAGQPLGDVPFCGSDAEHECSGAECVHRPPRIASFGSALGVGGDE
ncbi:hypothetical protein NM962_12615 [Mycobacterium sp. SVM_VP21]|nr:hypothetical protein NM962_12615 [Mycobacterium sp. SVM_VP21]